MQSTNNDEKEIKSWLEAVLAKEGMENLSIEISGNSEKGNGYAGDVVFVIVTGTDKHGSKKILDLVLKCSKSGDILRQERLMQDVFLNEIYVYDTVFPAFEQFQSSKGIEKPFSSIPKCYGTYQNDDKEVIVLENLKTIGYSLWSNKKPLTREHIDLVMGEYGKFHAISIAMREQEPKNFEKLAGGLVDLYRKFTETSGIINVFEELVEEIHDLLRNDLEEGVLQKWSTLKSQVRFIMSQMLVNVNGLKVIAHGDCWSNNFMYQYADAAGTKVSKVAMLDWQISKLSSPILDLSYFLFSCISPEDANSLDVILRGYYNSLSAHLKMLGSSFTSDYSLEQFLKEWKKYSRIGVVMALLPLKISYTEKDEVPDIAETLEKGEAISTTFMIEIKNKTGFKNRIKPIVEHAVEFGLLS